MNQLTEETRLLPLAANGVNGSFLRDGENPCGVGQVNDFALWQLVDSALPTGGFAHSGGLEAAWQQGEVSTRAELASYLETSLAQVGRAALPFATAAHAEPGRLAELDQLCDAFTTNHVANRASRLQGRAFLMVARRVFAVVTSPESTDAAPCAHWAPVFGAVTSGLGIPRDTAARLFLFHHLRGLLAAAVRLNVTGPMEAQMIQFRLASRVEAVLKRCSGLPLEDLAQTAPLLDLWQGAQDRLYSRLFQS